ncbi:DHH family phosphoesterase [Weissella diestrammenae]|uniref:Cyclic-di-AMP phosphodiesterase n=1 Tax=Weissella diestrammenae TaxID=1162633 RepID=A0A7G9T7I1_9LACO|nr:DHH family phosphoesterase [Weissella diestrammenae]MCM0583258.1 DHH family phosphoesterase [Weissella diestrammenae]QNN76056.1 DHH family phosphoesterase [Weissella diestrammenae]
MKHMSVFRSLPDFFQNKRLLLLAAWVTIMAVIGTVLAFMSSWVIGVLWVIIILCALFFVFNTLQKIGKDTQKYIASLSYRVNRGEQEAIVQMPLGVILFNENFEIDWINPYLQHFIGTESLVESQLSAADEVLANIVRHWDPEKKQSSRLEWLGRIFDVKVQPELRAVYLLDATKSTEIETRYENERLFIGMVSLDNYDEISERLNDSDSSALRSFVTTALTDWMGRYDIYLRRLAVDKYMIIGYREALRKAEQDKFSILNTIRETTSNQNTPITLSIGIAYHEKDVNVMAASAQTQLDLALGRGGDQVVVKSPNKDARFYGGTTNPMAKRTRVRARVISQALMELMASADQIFVMGHNHADMDSMGAALGVRRLAKMANKPAWVVVEPKENAHTDMQLLYSELAADAQTSDAIISPAEVLSKATENSLLIMVDHSKRSITESHSVYDRLQDRLVIIDHHRRGEEFPDKAVLVYIESYASSTAELVTELFEYQPRAIKGLARIEATALLAGIQLDTKSFTLRAGTRTFDAASYLRSIGADGKLIQNLMKDSVEDYRQRAHLIDQATIIDDYALVVAEDDRLYDSVSVAQAADSLLQIVGIERSFVIARRDDKTIGISARSNGTKNVQTLMEQLGGGGHLSNAATQITDVTTQEAGAKLQTLLQSDEEM